MHLKQLDIIGFKSFKNKITLKFPQAKKDRLNMTAIIGPNGAGKSNLIEAISWGLGEQSLKSLRSKKSEDVIFSGTKKKIRSNLAQVNLLFSNEYVSSDKKYKEFSIIRKIYRNNDGEYLINNSPVRLHDINLLMAEANFGQKSYSIISQGLTDKIITSSSIEKKNFFDEATGIKQYIYKKNQILRKINKSKDNLNQAEIALKEIKPHLASLTRQINKLSRKKEIKMRLFNLQKIYYQETLYRLNNEIKLLKEKRELAKVEKKKFEEKLNKYRQESKKLISNKINTEYEYNQEKYQEAIRKINQYKESKLKITIKQSEAVNKKNNESITQAEVVKHIKDIKKYQEKFVIKIKNTNNVKEIDIIIIKANNILAKIKELLNKMSGENIKKSKKDYFKKLEEERETINKKIEELNKTAKNINKFLSKFATKELNERKKLFSWQEKAQVQQNVINNINNTINEFNISLAREETRKQVIEEDIRQEKIEINTTNIVKPANNYTINIEQINNLKRQIELIGGIDTEVEKEYLPVKERYDFLSSQTSDIKESLISLKKIEQKLDEKIKNKFQKNFDKINQTFNKYFKIIFNGGSAKIIYTKSKTVNNNSKINDEYYIKNHTEEKKEETKKDEIEILANPPGKKIKNIQMLSGGEKALSSLALICAIISINKPPFVILDEADSMLDQANCLKFIKILKELRK